MSASGRALQDLKGVGKACLKDFKTLGVESVDQLARCNPEDLYRRLCVLSGQRHDICVLDVFRCAVAQARDPSLPAPETNWWHWSKKRKAAD